MGEILTVEELGQLLKMTRRQVYEMTATRTRTGTMRRHPIPVLRINGNLRFRRADIEEWIEKLAQKEAA